MSLKINRNIIGSLSRKVGLSGESGTNTYRDSTGLCLKLSKESTVVGSKWILPLKILEKKRQGKIILEMDEVTSIAEEIRKVLG